MRINLAHLRERAANGSWIDFTVFDARWSSGSQSDNARLLAQLTDQARASNLRVEQSTLDFSSGGRTQFFGSPARVDYLSRNGLPRWTHTIDA